MGLLLTIRLILSHENKKRDSKPLEDTYDDVYVDHVVDGRPGRIKIAKVWDGSPSLSQQFYNYLQEFLDLTDRQNPDFRYVL